ncbi:MAG: glycosyltransferase family A protein [Alteraurantiacibacter sp.]
MKDAATGEMAEIANRGDGTTPAISLILPIYNGERFLADALESILAQNFTNFELICVDDCSSDSTPAILRDYAARDSRVRVLTNESNMKLPASLNRGFAAAHGKWLSWTSDDNLLLPDTLATLADAMARHKNVDIVHADYRIIDEAGTRQKLVTTGPAQDVVIDNVIGCCFLYRREVDAKLGGYDEMLFGVEDYDFWLRAHAAGFTFHRIERELYLYRRHGGSLTDQRGRQIQRLVHDRLAKDVAVLPASPFRARARVRLATRDHFTLRPSHLLGALRDSPVTVIRHGRAIATWARHAAAMRVRRLLGR